MYADPSEFCPRRRVRAEALTAGRGHGGVLSFELAGGDLAQASRLLDGLELCLAATSLGDVESLALVPAMSSHREVPPDTRARLGIGDGLVRIAVGIEDAADLLRDIDRALGKSAA